MYSTSKIRRPSSKAIAIVIMAVLGFNLLNCMAYGLPDTASNFHIETDFMLWKSDEKMLDSNFTIYLYYIDYGINRTVNYTITVDSDVRTGNFTGYTKEYYDLPTNYYITKFKIEIENQTLLDENNIRIMKGVSGKSIGGSGTDTRIFLYPFEWTEKERNIAFAVFTSAIMSIFISLVGLKYYRKHFGIKIKGGN